MENPVKYIEKDKANQLQESISFLENFELTNNEIVEVRIEGKKDCYFSDLLNELGKINKRRFEILELFKKNSI